MGAAVCQALRASPVQHVIYISSDAVYADSDQPLTERSCAQPASLHGTMHLTREVMLYNSVADTLWKPRPLTVPMTSTISPAVNFSTVMTSPTLAWVAPGWRIS